MPKGEVVDMGQGGEAETVTVGEIKPKAVKAAGVKVAGSAKEQDAADVLVGVVTPGAYSWAEMRLRAVEMQLAGRTRTLTDLDVDRAITRAKAVWKACGIPEVQ